MSWYDVVGACLNADVASGEITEQEAEDKMQQMWNEICDSDEDDPRPPSSASYYDRFCVKLNNIISGKCEGNLNGL